jgi:two-component sensor histidine kinase
MNAEPEPDRADGTEMTPIGMLEAFQNARDLGRLRLLFEQAPGVMAMLRGPEHVFEMANAAYMDLIGLREIIGRTVREALPEVEGQGFFELLDEVYATGEPFIGTSVPVRLHRAADEAMETRFLDFFYQPVKEDDSTISGIFVQGHDVTERVMAERHMAVLLAEKERLAHRNVVMAREMSHRMVNSFHMIEALFSLQLMNMEKDDTGRGVIENARQRVHAMALVHRHLHQSNIADRDAIDVGEYLHSLVHELLPAFGGERCRATLTIPQKVMMEATQATAVGMLTTELIINACKYAFPYQQNGHLTIKLDATGARCCLTIDDDGAGLPASFDPKASTGIGMRLVQSFVRQLTGKLDIERLSPGTRFSITFPI